MTAFLFNCGKDYFFAAAFFAGAFFTAFSKARKLEAITKIIEIIAIGNIDNSERQGKVKT